MHLFPFGLRWIIIEKILRLANEFGGFFDSGMRYLYEFGKSVERRRLSLKGIVSWIFLLFFVKFLESGLKYAYESSHS